MSKQHESDNRILGLESSHVVRVFLGTICKYMDEGGPETLLNARIFGKYNVESVANSSHYIWPLTRLMLLAKCIE